MACAHTMKATGRDGVTYCCDCGKTFKSKSLAPTPNDEAGIKPASQPSIPNDE